MKIRRAYGLLDDGTTWEGIPVTPATSMQLEKSMKANNWNTDDNGLTLSTFMSWHAAKLAGVTVPERWEQFLASAVQADIQVDELDPTTVRDGISSTGPTPTPAAQPGPPTPSTD